MSQEGVDAPDPASRREEWQELHAAAQSRVLCGLPPEALAATIEDVTAALLTMEAENAALKERLHLLDIANDRARDRAYT